MKVVKCDDCGAEIPSNDGFELLVAPDGERASEDFCSVRCLERWLNGRYPVQRPDFAAAHAEIEKARAADALDDLVDTGALEPPDAPAEFEGEPFDIVGLLGRKTRAPGRLSSLGGSSTIADIRSHQAKAAE